MVRILSFVSDLIPKAIPSLVIVKNIMKSRYYAAMLYRFVIFVVLKRYLRSTY